MHTTSTTRASGAPTRVRVTHTTTPNFYLGRPRTIWLAAYSPALRPQMSRG